jgi:hypothetical protein
MGTLGDDVYGPSQIEIWLQRFRTGDCSCSDLPREGRTPLASGPQVEVEAFLQKYPFASTRIIAKHFLTTASTVKEIRQKELKMKKFSLRGVPRSLSGAQKIARVEAAKEMVRILQESEANDFDGIATGDESRFARSAVDVILRTRQAVGAKRNYDHSVLHGKETYRVQCSPKR